MRASKIRNLRILYMLLLVSGLFYFGIATDIIPYVRGPIDSITESRWPYYFVNTLNKLWAPFTIFFIYLILFVKLDSKIEKISRKKEFFMLTFIVFLVFLLHISLVYFSRFGITILFQRVLINGYFLASIHSPSAFELLQNFQSIVHTLGLHASDHPPGSILMIKAVVSIFDMLPTMSAFITKTLPVPDTYVVNIYNTLRPSQITATIFSAFYFHLLAAISVVPMYFLSKAMFGNNIALRATLLWGILPSLSFFAIKLDPFYAFFPLISFYFFFDSLKTNNINKMFFGGVIFGLGIFFSFSILPVLVIMTIYALLEMRVKKTQWILPIYFLAGLLFFFIILLIFGFNIGASFLAVIGNQAHREYLLWVIFNPYDFFFYFGIPLAVLFFINSYYVLKYNEKNRISFHLMISFWVTFILLTISGISRAEVGRIWLPLMFLPLILMTAFVTNTINFKKKEFTLILTLIFIQLVLIEEFWVPIW